MLCNPHKRIFWPGWQSSAVYVCPVLVLWLGMLEQSVKHQRSLDGACFLNG